MKMIKKTSEKHHVEFRYSEFLDHAKNRKRSEKAKTRGEKSSRNNSRAEWYGTKSFGEAMDFAESGWDSGLEQLALEDGVLAGTGVEMNANVSGAFVNMGNYLMGQPDNMWEMTEKRDYNLEELTICVRLDYSAGISGATALNFTKSIAEIVNEYQSKYAVRLVGRFDSAQANRTNYVVDVVIKDYNERFVLNNVAFSFHPSFFRRLWFSHLEGESFIDYGYGSPSDKGKHIKEFQKEYSGKMLITPQINNTKDGNFGIDKVIKVRL